MIEFGEKLKKIREEQGMTQQTLAEKLYVTRQAVSRWECGARYPELLTAKRISEVLNVSLDELLSGENAKLEVESKPVAENPIIKNLLIALYAFAAFSFGLMIADIFLRFNQYNLQFTSENGHVLSILTIMRYAVSMMVFLYGLVVALGNRLTPCKTGVIAIMFFMGSIVSSVLIRFFASQAFGFSLKLTVVNIVDIIPYLLMIISLYEFFVKGNPRKIWFYLQCVLFVFCFAVDLYASINSFVHASPYLTMNSTLGLITIICVYALLTYQSCITKKKRDKSKLNSNA